MAGLTQDVPMPADGPAEHGRARAKQQLGWERENLLLGTQTSQRGKKKKKKVYLLFVKF